MDTRLLFIERLSRYHTEAMGSGLSTRADEIWKELDRRIREFCGEGA